MALHNERSRDIPTMCYGSEKDHSMRFVDE